MSAEILELGASEILAAMSNGDFSAAEYARIVIDAAADQRALNAIEYLDRDGFLADARKSDQRRATGKGGALEGLPLILKNNINTRNLKTTAGTRALANFTPDADAPAVTAITSQGAIIAAKAGMHELAFGITSNNAFTGAVRNPYDAEKIPGGSSGGTAAAVAARIFPVGLGTDTGGSCRIPAALCGVCGFRPTTGRYDGAGVAPISHTRDTIGPIARNVGDIRLLDSALAGQSIDNSTADLSKLRIGVPRTVFFEDLEAEVSDAAGAVLKNLEAAGAALVEADFPEIWAHNEAFSFPVVFYEVMRNLPKYLSEYEVGVSFEELVDGISSPDVIGAIASQRGDGAMPEQAYRAAMDFHRPAMRQIYDDYFKANSLDAIVFPTTPLRARPIGQDETVELNGSRQPTFPTYIRNTDLGSNIGAPGITLPCGMAGGLPIGIEFDGLPGRDGALMSLAKAVEELLGPLPAPNPR